MSARRSRTLATTAAVLLLAAAAQAQGINNVKDVSPGYTNIPGGGAGGRVNAVAIDPANTLVMYAASEYGGLFKSVDGGFHWNRLDGHVPVLMNDVKVDPVIPNRVYATSFYDGRSPSQSGINVSTDGGITWTRPVTSFPPPNFCATPADQTELSAFGIAFERSNPAKIYIGTACGLAISTDSGMTWTYSVPAFPNQGHRVWDVVSAIPNIPDICGDNGHYFIFTGVWNKGTGLPGTVACSIASSPYYPSPLPNLFATTPDQKVYETIDGVHWQETLTNPAPQGRIPFVETNIRSGAPGEQRFDLWFGDVGLH